MGVTYGYLVGDFADAPRIAARQWGDIDTGAELAQKVIGFGPLQALEQLVCGRDSGLEYWGGDDLAVCFAEGADGPFVLRLPRPLVERLAALAPAAVPGVAARWTATDEFAPRLFPDISRPDLLRANELFLGDLAGLARRAVSSGQELLMWAEL
jgi:hypothetical protein